MKIGDRVFVHGYIDEIRKDTVIIRNEGGYFGTVPSEVVTGELPSSQPEWGKPVGDGRPLADSEVVSRLRDIQKQIGGSYAIDRAIEVLEVLPSAQPEQRWIPCSDRLPEEDVEALITDDSGGVQWLGIDKMLSYEDGSGRFWLYSQNPTAWMPLPEPYQGKLKGEDE